MPPDESCTLIIAAASDLAGFAASVQQVQPLGKCKIEFSLGSSGMLARQIRAGADFDVFLSANRRYVQELAAQHAVRPQSVAEYARGRLALWSRKGVNWKTLRTAIRISIANPVHAPYGVAARQAMERQGLWSVLEPRIVLAENVRQAWQFAATGNTDAALTAWALVHEARGAELIPETWHDPITQTAAIPARTRNLPTAERFLEWLRSQAGQSTLQASGFQPPALSRTSQK